jgi:SH3-like domain-containing protein
MYVSPQRLNVDNLIMMTRNLFTAFILTLFTVVSLMGAFSRAPDAQDVTSVPRYVSLRSDKVNVRTGPAVRYPVKWVFVRKFMPVEVIADYDTWRKIRDWEGAEGWVHQAMLSSRRYVIAVGGLSTLRQSPNEKSRAVAKLDNGVVAQVGACDIDWCKLSVGGYGGWLKRESLWGLKRGEFVR